MSLRDNIFQEVRKTQLTVNKFDLSHDVKQSMKMGELTPCCIVETLPGDRFKLSGRSLVRFAPLISPVMHDVEVFIHYFYVPWRLIWPNWRDFIKDPTAITAAIPQITIDGSLSPAQQRFLNYLGIPKWSEAINTPQAMDVIAGPMAAYIKIYNDYYRPSNIVTEVNDQLADGVQAVGVLADMRRRCYEHDYFTACQPSAQRDQAISLPVSQVVLDPDWSALPLSPRFVDTNGFLPTGSAPLNQDPVAGQIYTGAPATGVAYEPEGSLLATPALVTDLRTAFALQSFLEELMLAGSRYTEYLKIAWGVISSDSRLQRAEYIGGVKDSVRISEVLNTTGETGGLPQGNMAGRGVGVLNGYQDYYTCEEHGYILGIMSVRPKSAYQQGMGRMWLRTDPLDFPTPKMQYVGEQAVTNDELVAYQANGSNTFGYMARNAEMKYIPSRVAGDFTDSLDYWHLGRIFAAQPALNQTFLEVDPDDMERIFAVTSGEDYLYVHVANDIEVDRRLSYFATPAIT